MNERRARSIGVIKSINRQVAPVVTLLLLLAAGMLAHHIAMAHVDLIGELSAKVQPTVAGRVRFVEYLNGHPLITLPYLTVFAAGLFWMQCRELPRWSLWLTLAFFALPLCGYIWICFRISTGRSI